MSELTWWHVHADAPIVCYGGATSWDLADDLAQVHEQKGTTVSLVESDTCPDQCEYFPDGWIVLSGRTP